MEETSQLELNERGSRFEQRVFYALKRLEPIGFVTQLKLGDQISDHDGNIRRVDLTFILNVLFVQILISVECKSRERSISLDEVDQIKTFKREIPGRNLFWLVSEGKIGKNAEKALRKAGISFYRIDELEATIDEICSKYGEIEDLRHHTQMLSMMHRRAYSLSAKTLHKAQAKLNRFLKRRLRIDV